MTARHNIEDIYPLSPLQQGMLFHTLYAPDSGVYLSQTSFRIRGDFDPDSFRRALAYVVERHAVLRSSFVWKDLDKPVQVVHRNVPILVREEDWSGLPEIEGRERLEEYLARDAVQGFDLGRPPLMRLLLAREGEDAFRLVWTLHLLLIDGWSTSRVMGELLTCHEAFRKGMPPRLDPPRRYRDYIAWLMRQDSREAEGFWRRELAGFREPTPLPGDLGPGRDPAVSQSQINVGEETTEALQAFARVHQLTVNTLIQGAWALLLSRMSGHRGVVFGVTTAGRPPELPGAEAMVGPFTNTLPLRAEVAPEARLAAWLQQLQDRQSEARQLEHIPLVEVQGWSEVPRGVPLFESLLVFESFPVDTALRENREGLAVEEFRGREVTNYPLVLVGYPGRRLAFTLSWDRSRFEAGAADRLATHLVRLLEDMVRQPAGTLESLEHLPGWERHQLLVEWNDTRVVGPPPESVVDLFAAQAARTPEATALLWRPGTGEGASLTYRELDGAANGLAHRLIAAGVRPETRVALLAERSPELIIGLLGILKSGGAYVPLDPSHPAERLRFLLDDSGASVLVAQPHLLDRLPDNEAAVVLLGPAGGDGSDRSPDHRPRPGDLAYMIYTSGTTGAPKAVMVEHGSLAHTLRAARETFGFRSTDRMPCLAPASFDIFLFELFGPLLAGGTSVLLDLRPAPDLDRLAEELQEATLLHAVPALMRQIVQTVESARGPGDHSHRLRGIFVGGDAVPPDLLAELRSTFPQARTWVLYGPTESTIICTHRAVGDGDGHPWIGRPLPDAVVRLLDPLGHPVPIGAPGEIWVGGPGVARGYWNRADLTAERFVPVADERFFRTGDLARLLPNGDLVFLGRADHQVKIRGFRIELGEVEAALVSLPGVHEAVLVTREDHPGDRRLVAYVVGDVAAEELRRSLRERLPDYMVPAAFVALPALPRTSHGKVDRKALPAPEWQISDEHHLAPRTPVEEVLAGIWAEVLGLERVGATDSFFELGGHSLLATRVMSRLRHAFGVELPLRDLFESPTLADLATRVETARRAGAGPLSPPLVPMPRNGPSPLSFAQQRLWFIDQLEPGSSLYNMPVALRAEGRLDAGVLELTLGEIVRRHEILRTVFAAQEGAPVQVIQPAHPFGLSVVDLSGLPEGARETVALGLAGEEAGRPFDLRRGPLLRGLLLRLAQEDHIAALTLHHIVSDGWSMGILVREVAALYPALSEGRPSPLPELAVQYADFAAWQRGWLDREGLEGLAEHWRQRLAGAPPQLDLSGARPRPAALSPRGAARERRFPPSLLEPLRALGRRCSTTLFMTLLAPLQALLHSRTGATDLVIGTDVAGRDHRVTEGLVGFFINQLPLRADLSGDPTLRDLLGRARETALDGYTHQDLPFDHLVEALQVPRSLQRSPVFQVKLVLQNAPRESLDLPGLRLKVVPTSSGTAQLDLHWAFVEEGDKLWLALTYSTDLYDEALIDGLLDQYESWLHAFAERPEARLGDVAAELARAEQDRLADRGLEQKSKNLGKLRIRRRAEEDLLEVSS